MAQYTGEVKLFSNAKGYGFLGHDGGDHVFAYFSAMQTEGFKSLKEGDRVSFDVIQGERGRQADVVKLLITNSEDSVAA